MAGILKTDAVQLGDDADSSKNLVIKSNLDGTFTLARGNVGATTQDILTIDENGFVSNVQKVLFSAARHTGSNTIPDAIFTRVEFTMLDFNIGNGFDLANNRFRPSIAGYYDISGHIEYSGNVTGAFVAIYKNGSEYKTGTRVGSITSGSGRAHSVRAIVYLNGSTDYVELFAYQSTGSPIALNSAPSRTYMFGNLLAVGAP